MILLAAIIIQATDDSSVMIFIDREASEYLVASVRLLTELFDIRPDFWYGGSALTLARLGL